jgi:hydroxymethylpyrimidine/phosphomethylpyrimidine kinase
MPNTPNTYQTVLTIAGSDSGGGAGIQADLKTFSALGCYGMSVITALTAQNTRGVTGIHPVPPDFVGQQMDAIFTDMGADAVKIGMLFSPELIDTVAERLERYEVRRIVLDPVMVAQSGDRLLQDAAVEAIRERLMPLAEVVTPNLPEASVLLDREIRTREEMERAAEDLSRLGGRHILIKGGHLAEGDAEDLLYSEASGRFRRLPGERIGTRNTHGTGCTLSSAIAAGLARGEDPETAVRHAKTYIAEAIRAGAGYRLGEGHGPVHHFHRFWQ